MANETASASQTTLALVPESRPTGIVPRTLAEMMDMSKLLAQSEIIPKHFQNKPANVFVALEFGAELGLPPMASLRNVYVIEGRPSISAQAVHAVCISAPDCEYFRRNNTLSERGKKEVWECKRRGQVHVGEFTIEEARTANLLGKDNWKHYPADMLVNRAIARCGRLAYPDRVGGIHTSDELRDGVIDMNETMPGKFEAPPSATAASPAVVEVEVAVPAPAVSEAEAVPDQDDLEMLSDALDGYLETPERLSEAALKDLHARCLAVPKGDARTKVAAKYTALRRKFDDLRLGIGR